MPVETRRKAPLRFSYAMPRLANSYLMAMPLN